MDYLFIIMFTVAAFIFLLASFMQKEAVQALSFVCIALVLFFIIGFSAFNVEIVCPAINQTSGECFSNSQYSSMPLVGFGFGMGLLCLLLLFWTFFSFKEWNPKGMV